MTHLRPMLVETWKAKRNAIMAANVEKKRHVLDKLQQHLDEVSLFNFVFQNVFIIRELLA